MDQSIVLNSSVAEPDPVVFGHFGLLGSGSSKKTDPDPKSMVVIFF